jgi:hypothetical protein
MCNKSKQIECSRCENVIGNITYSNKAELVAKLKKLIEALPSTLEPSSVYIAGWFKESLPCRDAHLLETGLSISDAIFDQAPRVCSYREDYIKEQIEKHYRDMRKREEGERKLMLTECLRQVLSDTFL